MNAGSPTTSTPKPAIALSPEVAADPAVVLAMKIREKRNLHDEAEERSYTSEKLGKSTAHIFFDNAALEAYDAETALRDCLTNVEASTMEGAAIHIAEAISRFASIWSQVDQTKLHDQAGFDARAVDRLLYSALSVVLGAATHTVDDIAGEGFDNPQCNPWGHMAYAEAMEAGK